MLPAELYTQLIKKEALRLGFTHCGVSESGFLDSEAPRLEQWLKEGRHGKMAYMENHFDKRLDPGKLVPGAKSVVSLMFNYYQEEIFSEPDNFQISKYAYGEDYHQVIKDKLYELLHFIREKIGEVNGRAFTDSAPVLEKTWAVKSGLGWLGKNGNLIGKGKGSYFFLSELILDLPLIPDSAVTDHCGSCTRCIEACPTQAIYSPGQVDANRCISYLTIELKEEIPAEFKGNTGNWIFGCDVCMDVCPWNRFSTPATEPRFFPKPEFAALKRKDWVELTEETFGRLFPESAVNRTRYNGLRRNIDFLLNS